MSNRIELGEFVKAGEPPEREFIDWIGQDSRGVPYYLHLLNFVWSREGVEHDLQVFRRVEERLRDYPRFWSAIVRGAYGWRPSLVGCACLLLSENKAHSNDIIDGFVHGSMVQPQLAVTLGLLHPTDASSWFKILLEDQKIAASGRATVSLQRTLQLLGSFREEDVSLTGWGFDQQDHAVLADRVVRQHWEFWDKHLKRD